MIAGVETEIRAKHLQYTRLALKCYASITVVLYLFKYPSVCLQNAVKDAGRIHLLENHIFIVQNCKMYKLYFNVYALTVSVCVYAFYFNSKLISQLN
jgi:hypothetical protein